MIRIAVTITVDSSGNGEVTGEAVTGLLYAIQPVLGTLDDGLTLSVYSNQTGVDILAFEQAANFDENMIYPRTAEVDSAASPTMTYAMPLIAGNIHLVVADGGNATEGVFILYILDEFASTMKIVNQITDLARPTVIISSEASDPTSDSPIDVILTFSEAVTGLVAGDLVVSNGTAANLATTDNVIYTVEITPTVPTVDVTVDLPADSCVDLANNGNFAATQFTIGTTA